jgi:hypothetical protein
MDPPWVVCAGATQIHDPSSDSMNAEKQLAKDRATASLEG